MPRLSIGAFAQESGLSPKALRLYDDLGLLAPADVDARTGYRSYDRCRLATARLIVRLRVLGEAVSGDRYLLCTDGLTSVLDEQEISRALGNTGTSREAADRLVQQVRAAGAPDNVSCLVVDAVARA